MNEFEKLITNFMENEAFKSKREHVYPLPGMIVTVPYKMKKTDPVPPLPIEIYYDDKMIFCGLAKYAIDKYTDTEYDGPMLKMKLNGNWTLCTLNFLRELKKAHDESKGENNERL